jgi:hypothetical protein
MKQVVEPSGSLMSALLVLAFVVDPSWPVALLNAVTGGDSKSPLEIDWDAHFPKETDFEPPFKFHETLGVVPGQPTLRPDPARKTLFHGLTVVAIGHPNVCLGVETASWLGRPVTLTASSHSLFHSFPG